MIVKGTILSSAQSPWNDVKITARKDKLVNFLKTDKLFASCNYIFQTPEQILEIAKRVDCSGDMIKLEFKSPKDVLQLRQELRNQEKQQKNSPLLAKENNTAASTGSVEVCISSDGEISLSYSNEFGSIQATSKGKFSVSSKIENGTEYKVEL